MRATCGVVSARRPMHAAGELVDQLEGLQVQRLAGAGEQRLQVLQQRRHHQLVAVAAGGVEQFAAQFFDVPGLGRQDIGDVIRQDPGGHGDGGAVKNGILPGAVGRPSRRAQRRRQPLRSTQPEQHQPEQRCCTGRRSAAGRRCSCSSCWKVRRQPPGERKGNRPSNTSTRASAAQKVSLSNAVLLAAAAGAAGGRAAAAEGAEEVGAGRVDHHHVALLVEAGLVGLQAAVELGELRIAAEGLGVDARRPGHRPRP